jgi:DNA-directed RNA polymerase specialized sigma24 family protein
MVLGHIREMVATQQARESSDAELVAAFVEERDQAAFAEMVRRHGPLVLRVCRLVLGHLQDAEDAYQATFLLLARNCGSIRQKDSLAEWLHGVAYRVARNARRGTARRRQHEGKAGSGKGERARVGGRLAGGAKPPPSGNRTPAESIP